MGEPRFLCPGCNLWYRLERAIIEQAIHTAFCSHDCRVAVVGRLTRPGDTGFTRADREGDDAWPVR